MYQSKSGHQEQLSTQSPDSCGGTHMFKCTVMCHPNGLVFHKSLDMGPIFVIKSLKEGLNFLKKRDFFFFKSAILRWKAIKIDPDFLKILKK